MLWLNSKTDRPDFEWFTDFLNDIVRRGIKVARPVGEQGMASLLKDEAANVLRVEYGIVNPNSPKQLQTYIANSGDSELLSTCTVRENGGLKITTKEEVLAVLASAGNKFAMQVLKYRSNANILTNIESIMSAADGMSMIHPEVSFQASNRVSYAKPALMNINKKLIWSMVVPRSDENYLWSADVKNQEPWIMAHLTGAKSLIELAQKAQSCGGSFYRAVYEDIFKTPVVSEPAYAEMKMAWNMLTYGGSADGLRARCRIIDADKVYKYFNSIQELKQYRGRTFALKTRGVHSTDTVFGTKVYSNKEGAALQRSLMDLPIQGTGADILAMLCKHIYEEIDNNGLGGLVQIYFTRHDEIIFEVNKDWQDSIGAEEVSREIEALVNHRIDDWVPFNIDVEQLA